MSIHLKLPRDSAGYGDFGFSFINLLLRIQFQYYFELKDRVGEIIFRDCGDIKMFNIFENYMPHESEDIIYVDDDKGKYFPRKRYYFVLSNSNRFFDITANSVEFIEEIPSREYFIRFFPS